MQNNEVIIRPNAEKEEAINSIRQQLIENPNHPNLVHLLSKLEQLQGKGKHRIIDLRLAINYSRNSYPYLDVWDCMICHKEIASIYKYLATGKLEYKIPPELDKCVQLAVSSADMEGYIKQYPDYIEN